MKHARVTTTSQDDDKTIIETDSYYEKLSHSVREIERKHITSRQTVVADIIKILEHITKEDSPKVEIIVEGRDSEPVKLIERWTEYKQSYSRK